MIKLNFVEDEKLKSFSHKKCEWSNDHSRFRG